MTTTIKTATGMSLMDIANQFKQSDPSMTMRQAKEQAKGFVISQINTLKFSQDTPAPQESKLKNKVASRVFGQGIRSKVAPVIKKPNIEKAPEASNELTLKLDRLENMLRDLSMGGDKLREKSRASIQKSQVEKNTEYAAAVAALAALQFKPVEIRTRLAGLKGGMSAEQIIKYGLSYTKGRELQRLPEEDVAGAIDTTTQGIKASNIKKGRKNTSPETDIAQQEAKEVAEKEAKVVREKREQEFKEHILDELESIKKKLGQQQSKKNKHEFSNLLAGSIYRLFGRALLGSLKLMAKSIGFLLAKTARVLGWVLSKGWQAASTVLKPAAKATGSVLKKVAKGAGGLLMRGLKWVGKNPLEAAEGGGLLAITALMGSTLLNLNKDQQARNKKINDNLAKYGIKILTDKNGANAGYMIKGKRYTAQDLENAPEGSLLNKYSNIIQATAYDNIPGMDLSKSVQDAKRKVQTDPSYKSLEIAPPVAPPVPPKPPGLIQKAEAAVAPTLSKAETIGKDIWTDVKSDTKYIREGIDDLKEMYKEQMTLLPQDQYPPIVNKIDQVINNGGNDSDVPLIQIRNGEPSISSYINSIYENMVVAPLSNM